MSMIRTALEFQRAVLDTDWLRLLYGPVPPPGPEREKWERILDDAEAGCEWCDRQGFDNLAAETREKVAEVRARLGGEAPAEPPVARLRKAAEALSLAAERLREARRPC